MRAVLVGAGASGLLHGLAFRAAGVRIDAVYDPDPSRARALAELVGGRVLPTFEAAEACDADVAAICSPPSVHVEQALRMAAARADRRAVFVEKPVATTTDDLARLLTAPICVPVVQWRAGRAAQALRKTIATGELGDAPVASCDLAWGRDDAYFAARRDWGCGALLSIGIHAIDAIAWAFGRAITGVSGMVTAMRPGATGETGAVAVLRFAGGGSASLRVSLDGGDDATRIVVCGGGVTARIEGAEADPTGRPLSWITSDERTKARLEDAERSGSGSLGSPLLVPYVAGAIRALRDGARPGECEAVPSIASVARAHEAAIAVARSRSLA